MLLLLQEKIRQNSKKVKMRFSYSEQSAANGVYSFGTVESFEYLEDGIEVVAVMEAHGLGKYQKYIVEE